jgi:TrmH family RNA methyltransferase
MKISSKHPDILEYKQLVKESKDSNFVATSDLTILKLAYHYALKIKVFFYCDEISYQEETKQLIKDLSKYASVTYTISKTLYEQLRIKENSAGLFGIIEFKHLELDSLAGREFLVVCDRLEIPGNLGTIYRTMDACKAEGLIIVDGVTKPSTSKLTQASRGCNLLIPTVQTDYESAQKWLLQNGYTIYLGEPNLGHDYQHYKYKGKIAIVVGSERFGINEKWYQNPHEKVYIPMYGSNNSLNVAVACSILLFEACMKKNK